MLQDDESLALALRGGLRGRFQGTFNQLENAVEVLDDYMLQHLNPAEYADLRTMMREINWQLAYLRRLGDHAADDGAAPDDGIGLIIEQKVDGHDLDAGRADAGQEGIFRADGLLVHPERLRDGGAGDVGVQNADAIALAV